MRGNVVERWLDASTLLADAIAMLCVTEAIRAQLSFGTSTINISYHFQKVAGGLPHLLSRH